MKCVLKWLTNVYKNVSEEEEIAERVSKAIERFVVRSFHEKDHQWKSTTNKHDDYDVTFILPMNTKKQYAIYISMNQ